MAENIIPVSQLVPVDKIPSDLSFLKDGITAVFSNLYISDLQADSSIEKDYTYYSFNLVSFQRIAVDILGTDGLALVLNPGIENNNYTEIPISIGYSWPILKYIDSFQLESFNFSAQAFFNLLLTITNATEQDLLSNIIEFHYAWTDVAHDENEDASDSPALDERSPMEKFAEYFNDNNSPVQLISISSSSDYSEVLDDLVSQFSTNGNTFDVLNVIYSQYILATSLEETFANIERLFQPYFGDFSIDDIKALLVPKVSASIDRIDLALQFPRSVLVPIDTTVGSPTLGQPNPDPNAYSLLIFQAGSLFYSTQEGLSFEELSSFSFPKSEIAGTGLTLEVENLKLDLSRTTNIPEASADGRPDDFVGVFVEHAEIGLPKQWADNGVSAKIFGKNLIIGTGGLSGTIGLQDGAGTLNKKFGNGFAVELDAFDLTFQQNVITGSHIKGALTILGFKDKTTGFAK